MTNKGLTRHFIAASPNARIVYMRLQGVNMETITPIGCRRKVKFCNEDWKSANPEAGYLSMLRSPTSQLTILRSTWSRTRVIVRAEKSQTSNHGSQTLGTSLNKKFSCSKTSIPKSIRQPPAPRSKIKIDLDGEKALSNHNRELPNESTTQADHSF